MMKAADSSRTFNFFGWSAEADRRFRLLGEPQTGNDTIDDRSVGLGLLLD
jgi:hypothetical protein